MQLQGRDNLEANIMAALINNIRMTSIPKPSLAEQRDSIISGLHRVSLVKGEDVSLAREMLQTLFSQADIE